MAIQMFCEIDGEKVYIKITDPSAFHRGLLVIKALPGRVYEEKIKKWSIPLASAPLLFKGLEEGGIRHNLRDLEIKIDLEGEEELAGPKKLLLKQSKYYWEVYFDHDWSLKHNIKSIKKGTKWREEDRCWLVPLNLAGELHDILLWTKLRINLGNSLDILAKKHDEFMKTKEEKLRNDERINHDFQEAMNNTRIDIRKKYVG